MYCSFRIRNYSESACAESSITSQVTGVAVARVSGVRCLIIRAARPARAQGALAADSGRVVPAVGAHFLRALLFGGPLQRWRFRCGIWLPPHRAGLAQPPCVSKRRLVALSGAPDADLILH